MNSETASRTGDTGAGEKYKWIGIVTVVAILVGYAIYTGTPIKKMTVGEVEVEFAVRAVDAKPGPSTYAAPAPGRAAAGSQGDGAYAIAVPGEAPLPLSKVDQILLVPGEDDPQGRHLELVERALDAGATGKLHSEPDRDGQFSLWLTHVDRSGPSPEINYMTRLVEHDGTVRLAMRTATRQGQVWLTRVSPELQELAGVDSPGASEATPAPTASGPQVRSAGEIRRALDAERPRLVRGQLTAIGLLNHCFLDGEITREELNAIASRERSVAVEVGLTMDAAYAIAEFGYALYEQREFLGAEIFWEAMTLLNDSDAYFHNMHGASLEGLGRLEPARAAYQRAVDLDPNNADARRNLRRLQTARPAAPPRTPIRNMR
jgi:hypothetical protein